MSPAGDSFFIMKLLEEKIVKIGDKEFLLKMSIRAMIEFEKLSGHSISEIVTLEDIVQIFYCTVKAGGANISYDEFMDLIDDSPESISDFKDVMLEPGEKKKRNKLG